MSFYEQRISVDLEAIRGDILKLGHRVDDAVRAAVRATLTRDRKLAYETIIGDAPINRESERITAECHAFIARHLPSAGPLRFVSSAIRLVVLFERVGDYAATICRESVQLQQPLSGDFRDKMKEMAEDADRMMSQALKAFADRDEQLATDTIAFARQIDREFASAYSSLATADDDDYNNEELLRRLVIIRQLERVSDQAKNLCEEIVFFITGETKKRRPVRVLFVADRDDAFTQMAVAIGRRFCADRAEFDSMGRSDADEVQEDVLKFLSEHGFETDDLAPLTEPDMGEALGRYDVAVVLDEAGEQFFTDVPYSKIVLEWWIPDSSSGASRLEDGYRFLRSHVEDLIELLRGEAAEGVE